MIAVMKPRRPASRAGSSKPSLSRANHSGAETAAKIGQDDRQRGDDRQHAAAPPRDVVRDQQVDDDVGDLDELGALQGVPAADGHDRHQPGADERQQHDDRLRGLARRLVPVGVLEAHVVAAILGHTSVNIQSRGRPRDDSRSPAGVVELVDTPALGAGGASHGGSSPSARTGGVAAGKRFAQRARVSAQPYAPMRSSASFVSAASAATSSPAGSCA